VPAELVLSEFLPYRCTRLAERISHSLSRIYIREFDVSIPQWRILATLAEGGELQAREIGIRTSMDKVRVSRAVSGLVERGLLRRRPCERDSRSSQLSLTAAGRRLYRRIAPRALEWEQRLVSELDRDERTALFAALAKLERRLGEIESVEAAG
jgi:DNA-binding MarR family transcriptional regulator